MRQPNTALDDIVQGTLASWVRYNIDYALRKDLVQHGYVATIAALGA